MMTFLALHPLLIPPDLAKEIGLHEAVILQQIHYWLEKSNYLINGCRWIYNTYQAWQEQFPFLSLCAIRRAIARLEGMNLGIGLLIHAVKSRQKPSADQTRLRVEGMGGRGSKKAADGVFAVA